MLFVLQCKDIVKTRGSEVRNGRVSISNHPLSTLAIGPLDLNQLHFPTTWEADTGGGELEASLGYTAKPLSYRNRARTVDSAQ